MHCASLMIVQLLFYKVLSETFISEMSSETSGGYGLNKEAGNKRNEPH